MFMLVISLRSIYFGLVISITLACLISESPRRYIQETALQSSWPGFKSTSGLSKFLGRSGERGKQEWGTAAGGTDVTAGQLSCPYGTEAQHTESCYYFFLWGAEFITQSK